MEKPFFDSKTILALIAVVLVFIGWQKYLEWKYPEYYRQKRSPVESETSKNYQENLHDERSRDQFAVNDPDLTNSDSSWTPPFMDSSNSRNGKWIKWQSDLWEAEVDPLGFTLIKVTDKKYRQRNGDRLEYLENGYFGQVCDFQTGKPLLFRLDQVGSDFLQGEARTEDGSLIRRRLEWDQDHHALKIKTSIIEKKEGFRGLKVRFGGLVVENTSSLLNPAGDLSQLGYSEDGMVFRLLGAEEGLSQDWGALRGMALSRHYFTMAWLERSEWLPQVSAKVQQRWIRVEAIYPQPPLSQGISGWEQVAYLGPKMSEILEKGDPAFTSLIDLGYFSSIGVWILRMLKVFHSALGNWGWAIILLTVVIRGLVLPFNLLAYKSMKKMQAIQPKLQELRERYQNDPQAMNQATMELMKKEKINPLGGCLPMLLQMPIFFALYQVLSHAIELYQAPFIWWIKDLSYKDPFYVLPLLMGITLFIQHRITPTTLDPVQAKIMGFLPIIFTIFTLGLPAGLTLYIFVSTLFGVVQQQIFMRDTRTVKAKLKEAT